MFAYCGNCPVSYIDSSGNYPVMDLLEGEEEPIKITVIVGDYGGMTKQQWHEANRRPNTGEPNSEYNAPNGDKRFYGEDGKPYLDYDHDDHDQPGKHPHDANGGHWHVWTDEGRSKEPTDHPIIGAGKILGGSLLLVAIIADDLTGIGEADNIYVDKVIIWIEEGWTAVFG